MNKDFKVILILFALIAAVMAYLIVRQKEHKHMPFPDMQTELVEDVNEPIGGLL